MRKPDLHVFVSAASCSGLHQIVCRADGLRQARLHLQVRGGNAGMGWDRPRAPLWVGLHLTPNIAEAGRPTLNISNGFDKRFP
jgi:hypothetical protein